MRPRHCSRCRPIWPSCQKVSRRRPDASACCCHWCRGPIAGYVLLLDDATSDADVQYRHDRPNPCCRWLARPRRTQLVRSQQSHPCNDRSRLSEPGRTLVSFPFAHISQSQLRFLTHHSFEMGLPAVLATPRFLSNIDYKASQDSFLLAWQVSQATSLGFFDYLNQPGGQRPTSSS